MSSEVTTTDIIEPTDIVVKKFGRPSKLTPEIVAEAWQYLNNISVSDTGRVPTIEGLALSIGISRDTIYDWVSKDISSDFSDIVKQLQAMQAEKLLQNSLLGKYNPMIAKLMLSKHGYIEKSETDTKVELVQPILGGKAKEVTDDNQDT